MTGNCLPGRSSKKERTHARHNYNKNLRILRRSNAFCIRYDASSLVSYLVEAAIFERRNNVTIPDIAGFSKHRSRLNRD